MHAAVRAALAAGVLWWAGFARSEPLQSTAGVEAGARAVALGDAGAAGAGDATAVFSNPAGLAPLEGGSLVVAHRRLGDGLGLDTASFAVRPVRGSGLVFGAGAHLLRAAGRPSDESAGGFGGDPGASGYLATAQAAWRATPRLGLGAGFGRVATLPLGAPRASGWVASAGLLFVSGGTRAGAALRDASFGMRAGTEAVRGTSLWSLGIGQTLLRDRFDVVLQLDRRSDADPQVAAGAEWWIAPAIALRSGWRGGASGGGPDLWSAGAGVRRARVQLDYAWRGAGGRESEHMVSLHLATSITKPDAEAAPVPPRRAASAAPARSPVSPPRAREDAAAAPAARPQPPSPTAAAPARAPANREAAPASATAARREDTAPPSTPQAAGAAQGRFVVRAGIHGDLDSAAQEIARLYRGELRPNLERRGALYVVVLQRCATRDEARAWQERARASGVRCSIDEE